MPPLGQVPPGAFRPLRTPLTTPLGHSDGLENDSVKSIVTVSDSWNNAVQSFLFHLNQIQILGKQNNRSKEPESYSNNRRKYRQGRHFQFSPQAAFCLTTPLPCAIYRRYVYNTEPALIRIYYCILVNKEFLMNCCHWTNEYWCSMLV